MPKFSKKELKNILKECLTEIFTKDDTFKDVLKEALLSNANTSVFSLTQSSPKTKNNKKIKNAKQVAQGLIDRADMDDLPPSSLQEEQKINPVLLEKANRFEKSFGPQFANIFADTALTTLQDQENGVTAQQLAKDDVQIQKLAGPTGDMSHWAKIAFAKTTK